MMVKIEGVCKNYLVGKQYIHALREVNLEIKEKAFLAIQGPSGAGKSTLLHIIGGLGKPDKGRVIFKGEDIYSWNEAKLSDFRNRKIGFIFQFYHLLPELTLLENIMLPAILAGENFSDAKRKATHLLNYFLLDKRKDSFPSQLSGGEQQRGAIARALINEPELLLCDEPTGNLDSKLGQEVLKFIRMVNEEKAKTVIIVTHNQDIAREAKEVIYLKDGMIIGKEDTK